MGWGRGGGGGGGGGAPNRRRAVIRGSKVKSNVALNLKNPTCLFKKKLKGLKLSSKQNEWLTEFISSSL